MNPPDSNDATTAPPPTAPPKPNWPLFFGILLAPALLTCLLFTGGAETYVVGAFVALLGSVMSGVACAILLNAGRQDPGIAGRVIRILFCSVLFFGLSLTLCIMGCALGFGK